MSEGRYAGYAGGIDVKVTHSTQGVSIKVDVKRPLEPGESYQIASERTAEIVAGAYAQAVSALADLGLTPGKAAKP